MNTTFSPVLRCQFSDSVLRRDVMMGHGEGTLLRSVTQNFTIILLY